MSSGQIVAFLVTKPSAVASLRVLVGPTDPSVARVHAPVSLRARFGVDMIHNAVDCSADAVAVIADTQAFFPRLVADRVPAAEEVEVLLSRRPATTSAPLRPGSTAPQTLRDVISAGLAQLCRVKPQGDDAIRWLAHWLRRNNPAKPQVQEPIDVEDDDDDDVGTGVGNSIPGTTKSILVDVAITAPTTIPSNPSAVSLPNKVTVLPLKDHKALTPLVSTTASSPSSSSSPVDSLSRSYHTGARVLSVTPLDQRPKLIFALGAPGTNEDQIIPAMAESMKVDYINVPALLAAAENQHTDYGRVLTTQRQLGRRPPPHIIVALLKRAIDQAMGAHIESGYANPDGTANTLFVVSQFPQTLDDAFEAEKVFGSPLLVVSLTSKDDATISRLTSSSNKSSSSSSSGQSRLEILAPAKNYVEMVAPVVEHYEAFKKILSLDTSDTQATAHEFARLVGAPAIKQALKSTEPKERPPKRRPVPPKRKEEVEVDV